MRRLFYIAIVMLAGCVGMDPNDNETADTSDALSAGTSGNEVDTGWLTCSAGPGTNCGGPGGAGKIVDTFFHVNVSGGARAGVAEEHTAAGVDYGTSYWYRQVARPTFLATGLDYSMDLFVPAANDKYQAIELDTQQEIGGFLYNYGWQFNLQAGVLRWFDYAKHSWEVSGLPFAGFATNVWHHIHAHYSVHGADAQNDYIEIDSVRHVPTVSTLHPRVGSGSEQLTIGLQMDQNSAGDAMALFWDSIDISYTNDAATPPPPSCGAPKVVSPFDGQTGVGSSIELSTSAPSCIVTTKCYLASSGSTAVATGGQNISDVWVAVPVGADSIACNGWDASGKAYVGAASQFTRP